MPGKPVPFRYSSTPPPKETTRDHRDRYEKSRGTLVEPLDKEPCKKRTPQVEDPTMSSTITMATVHEVNTSEEEHIQEELDNEQLQSRTPMPVPGPSHDKGKQRAVPARDLMRDPNDSDPSSDNSSSEPEKTKKKKKEKKSRRKKPSVSDSDDSGDDSDPSSSDDDRHRKKRKKHKHRHHSDTDDNSDSDENRIKKGTKLRTRTHLMGQIQRSFPIFCSNDATPLCLLYWEEFVYELQEHFGPVDMEEGAEEDLEDLKMGTNHWATKYFISFAKYKARTQYNDRGYYRMVKNALPDRILTYESLRQAVLQIDQCYWQTRREGSRLATTVALKATSLGLRTLRRARPPRLRSPIQVFYRTLIWDLMVDSWMPSKSAALTFGLCIVCELKGHIAKDCNKARWNNNQASGSGSNYRPAPKAHASNTEEKPNTDDKAKAKDSTSGSKN
ncbi:hypothetical protein M422DRAFT_258023 [Sphaerobolus stellatus SS14]|uniref:CCHC-type domain-containing protein n=1 Tax=Sphaerobolus stellatus (strain SS14) TaxID=990650 RepID=A0A0C9UW90_SPHS4|nr:hypothetical protein M422DRAFT_258023 [Sphaerobolus stellatus SS14]